MKTKTFNFIIDLIRTQINENMAAIPTNSASSGAVSGLSGKEGDLPPIDLRNKKYKNLPNFYKDLFRRKKRV